MWLTKFKNSNCPSPPTCSYSHFINFSDSPEFNYSTTYILYLCFRTQSCVQIYTKTPFSHLSQISYTIGTVRTAPSTPRTWTRACTTFHGSKVSCSPRSGKPLTSCPLRPPTPQCSPRTPFPKSCTCRTKIKRGPADSHQSTAATMSGQRHVNRS